MHLLCVPNWSFGRDRRLTTEVCERLEASELTLHFCKSDVDHNRTVTAFSGDCEKVKSMLFELAALILPSIDLNRHVGVHPRIGGLDVCPFLPLTQRLSLGDEADLLLWIERTASQFAAEFDIPIFLYEKSERGRHKRSLPALRKGGFGGMIGRDIEPDFGPDQAHKHLGVTVMGWRNFLVALNSNLKGADPIVAKRIAKFIRDRRAAGDAMFQGVRALGFPLASRELSQVSMNITEPDTTPIDPLLECIELHALREGRDVDHNELIGVIRYHDLEHATRLHPRPEQIVTIPYE